ncbi:uncharacterized protein AC631_03013 [Debaryomyces fabryi]|uniref:Uncharacterized protein n=1 Tax=Debaryomyces fabryi TaxID=58627 RepID=A0A0V1PYJ5_9ASCO|nr:uncharacterized protein AC631_03013 [Debaryomyces fabryi]KSA01254.1 hypothetical protein AC631_03013 [Debaryomyces fabryi]CUM47032.1 unnamed protein product [Debaryomyces fabryi]
MIPATRSIALKSLGAYKNGLISLHLSQGVRAYSIKTSLKQLNKRINRFGEESTRESEITLKILRKIGGVSVIVVLCLILWASTLVDNPVSEPLPLPDLSKDVRDT